MNVSWPRQITHASLHPPLTTPTLLSTQPFSSSLILTSHPPSDSVHVTANLHPSRRFSTIDSRDIIRSRPLAELPTIALLHRTGAVAHRPLSPKNPPYPSKRSSRYAWTDYRATSARGARSIPHQVQVINLHSIGLPEREPPPNPISLHLSSRSPSLRCLRRPPIRQD